MKAFPQNRNPAQNARMPIRPTWSTTTRHRTAVVISITSSENLLPGFSSRAAFILRPTPLPAQARWSRAAHDLARAARDLGPGTRTYVRATPIAVGADTGW